MESRRPLYVALDAHDDSIEREVLGAEWDIRMIDAKGADDPKLGEGAGETAELLERADVVAVWHTVVVGAALLRRFRNAKVLIRMGVGYDNVDVEAAGRLGLPVCNVPDYGTEEVADSALALILSLYRGTWASAAQVAAGARIQGADGIAEAAGGTVRRVRGSVLGLVGLGRIGTAVATRAKAFGFEVLFFDPYQDDGCDKALGVRRVESLHELFRRSACVSLHCNCTKANENMVDAAALAQAPAGAMLVNTARGELVDELALAAALREGRLAAAALDVHWHEPFTTADAALGGAPNLLCTPHCAWFSPESRREMRVKGARQALRALELGDRAAAAAPLALRNVVNRADLAAAASS
eukprot:g7916.t1